MCRDGLAVFVIEIKLFCVISLRVDAGTRRRGRASVLRWHCAACQSNIHGLWCSGSVD